MKKTQKFPKKNPPLLSRPKLPIVKSPPRPKFTTSVRPTTTTTQLVTTTKPPTTTAFFRAREEGTTFSPQIQAIVNEYQEKGHVVSQPTYSEPVLQAIQKNFEHKKNVFEQFVTFDENDKAFVPNKEVVNSDWSFDNAPLSDLSDKILVYQTLAPLSPVNPTTAPAAAPVKLARTNVNKEETNNRRNSGSAVTNTQTNSAFYPNERNAEGGFKPIIQPLVTAQN